MNPSSARDELRARIDLIEPELLKGPVAPRPWPASLAMGHGPVDASENVEAHLPGDFG